jgi:hypothetical protein
MIRDLEFEKLLKPQSDLSRIRQIVTDEIESGKSDFIPEHLHEALSEISSQFIVKLAIDLAISTSIYYFNGKIQPNPVVKFSVEDGKIVVEKFAFEDLNF